jgi:hypothetical protein
MANKQYIFRSHWSDAVIPKVLLTDFMFANLSDADHGNGDRLAFVNASDIKKSYTFTQFKKLSYAVRSH